MGKQARDVIRQYIPNNSLDHLADVKRLCAFIDEFMIENTTEKRILKQGIQYGVLDSLVAQNNAANKMQVALSHVQKVEEELGLSTFWATYMVEEMIQALQWNISIQQTKHTNPVQKTIQTPQAPSTAQSGWFSWLNTPVQSQQVPASSKPVPTTPVFTYSSPRELFDEWSKRVRSIHEIYSLYSEVIAHVVSSHSNYSESELRDAIENCRIKVGFSKRDFIRCLLYDSHMGGESVIKLPNGEPAVSPYSFKTENVEKFLNALL